MLKKITQKKLWLTFILLSLTSLLYIYSLVHNSSPSLSTPLTTPTLSPTPNPLYTKVVNFFPLPNSKLALSISKLALTIEFDQPILLENFKISSVPSVNFSYSLSPNKKTLWAQPNTAWKTNTDYSVTVLHNQEVIYQTKFSFISSKDLHLYEQPNPPGGI